MKKKILLWRKIEKNTEWDIQIPTDYHTFISDVRKHYGNNLPNWGNKLWFQGICSEIDTGENDIYYKSNESFDEINNKYDLIIYPMANIFGPEYRSNMIELSETFKQIKIPVYIIACGVQAKEYNELEDLIAQIGDESKRFISSIYETGGEFALRGNFTKEFFDRLGFHSAVVTGCPSLYQLGPDFQIDNRKVDKSKFKPMFNGNISYFSNVLGYYKNSPFIDQDQYLNELYDDNYTIKKGLKSKIQYYKYSIDAIDLFAQNRIKLIPNMNDWFYYIKNEGFNYSIGSRIHGSIMPILSGVPATLIATDTRTKEMADFFNIPYIRHSTLKKPKPDDIYELYLHADYSKFNAEFSSKYKAYEKFLRDHDIVNSINPSNKFFDRDLSSYSFENSIKNIDKFSELYNEIKNMEPILYLATKVFTLLNIFK